MQGLLFALLLVVRGVREGTRSDRWLALLLVVLSLSLVTPLIGFANVYDRNQWLTYFPFSIDYLPPVLVLFYVRSLTNSKWAPEKKDLLYLIPTAIYLIFRFSIFAQTEAWKKWFDNAYYVPYAEPAIFVTEFVWGVLLLGLSIRHYRQYRGWLNDNYSDTEKLKFNWLRNFLYVFATILLLGGLFDFTNSFISKLSYIQYFYFEIILALATYYLAVAGYLRSKTIELTFLPAAAEARRSLLSDDEMERLKQKLEKIMADDRPYLEPSLTLTDLTRRLGVNSGVLSHLINQGFAKNFNDFINEYRLNEVISRLKDADGTTVLGIAFESGFNSKATFNRAFKKFTGLSPREFQDDLTRK